MAQLPRGIFCRKCKQKGCRVTGRYHPLPGVRIRYLRCPNCGYRFRTTERDGPMRSSGEDVIRID